MYGDRRDERCISYMHQQMRKMLLAPGLPGALFFKLQKIQILKFQKNI
jgi:hypothetical protein